MPKIEYKNIGVCHIKYNDDQDLKTFIEKNDSFIKDNTLIFDYLNNDLIDYLDSKGVIHILSKNVKFSTRSTEINTIHNDKNNNQNNANIIDKLNDVNNNQATKNQTIILYRVIRSGEYIESSGDIVIFNRVNSTAIIKSHGNVFIYGQCDGDVECNGECILLSKITNGKIMFNGEIINADMLKYRLNLISIKDNKLLIQNADALIA